MHDVMWTLGRFVLGDGARQLPEHRSASHDSFVLVAEVVRCVNATCQHILRLKLRKIVNIPKANVLICLYPFTKRQAAPCPSPALRTSMEASYPTPLSLQWLQAKKSCLLNNNKYLFQKCGEVLEADIPHSYWTAETFHFDSFPVSASAEHLTAVLLLCAGEHRF